MFSKTWTVGLLVAATVVSASDVTQLNKDTFDAFIQENDLVLAEFYAPWCGHCKALANDYEEAATSLKVKNVPLVKVDCTEEIELCKQQGVEGYPTLKIFRGAENVSPYKGQRKAAAITSYMIKQSLPAVSALAKETLEDFKKADKVVLVAYFDATDKESNQTFSKVAEKLRDSFLFGASSDAALAAAEEVKAPAIVLYKDFDEGKAVFTEKFDEEAIEKFATTAATPLVGEVDADTYSVYMDAGIPLAYIFAETPEERKELAELLRPIAKMHRGKMSFATIDAKAFGAHAGNLNLKTDKFPAFAVQDTVSNKKYPFNQDTKITHDAIKEFVELYHAGKIEPSVKSEPVPETQDGPVTVVVAKNYDQVVLADDKDVLVEFYAPWCGHCKALAPKYEKLATLYAASDFKDKVVIAKLDATANDVPDEISGFPTLKMYPAGDKKEPITYSGSRTVEDIVRFIAESGKYKASVTVPSEEEAEEEEEVEKPLAPAAAETETTEEADAAEKVVKKEKTEKAEKAEQEHDEL